MENDEDDVSGMIEYEDEKKPSLYQRAKGRWREHKENQARREEEKRDMRDQFASQREESLREERRRAVVSAAKRSARLQAQREVQQSFGDSSGGGKLGRAARLLGGSPLGTGEFLGFGPSGKGKRQKSRNAFDIMRDMGKSMDFMGMQPRRAPRKKKKKKGKR